MHRTRALTHQQIADAAQKKEAFRQQQLPGKPPKPVGVLALRPDRSTLLPRHVPGSARDVTMRELKQFKLRIPDAKGGFGTFGALDPKGPLPHDVTMGSRVLPLKTTLDTEVQDILTGVGAMRVRSKQRARLQTPSLTEPTHGSTQMLSMFEEAKTQPVTATTLALGAPSTVSSPFEEAKTADLVSTIGESEVASTVPIGPEIGIEELPGGIDLGKIGPGPQLPRHYVQADIVHRPFLQQAPTTPDLPEFDIFPLRSVGGVQGVRTVVKGRRRQQPVILTPVQPVRMETKGDYDEQQAKLKVQQEELEAGLIAIRQSQLPVERVETGGGLRVKTRARVADPVQVQPDHGNARRGGDLHRYHLRRPPGD